MTDTPTPLADVAVTDLNAADSAAMLVSMSAAYKAANPTAGPWGLSAEEANAQLAAMAADYAKANAPKLAAADQTILGESADVTRAFETTTWPEISTRNKLSTIEMLRDVGIPDPGIARVISGEPYSREDYAAAVAWRTRVERDPDFRTRLFAGDPAARHVLTAMSVIISMGPGEAK